MVMVDVDVLLRLGAALGPSLKFMRKEELEFLLCVVMPSEPVRAEEVPRYESGAEGAAAPEGWVTRAHRGRTCTALVLTGRPKAGKDTVAAHLARRYRQVRRLAFSDAIIREVNTMLEDLDPGTRHHIHEGNKSHPVYRRLLQDWGIIQRRAHGPHYWVEQVLRQGEALAEQGAELIVITGARSPEDVRRCGEYGAAVWRVDRPALEPDPHPVESLLDAVPPGAWDAYLVNREGDLPYLHRQAEVYLERRGNPRVYLHFLPTKEAT